MQKRLRSLLATVLAMAMIVTSMSVTAFAENDNSQKNESIIQEQESENDANTSNENNASEKANPIDEQSADTGEKAVSRMTMGTKPNDGETTGQPFMSGTGESNNFRIPALVTSSNGTLVAAADARWNTTYDGGGLDTIVSRSSDNGGKWEYTFANYLGDNGNTYDGSNSTAFIDPSLVVKGNTIYMLCDLYPYGVALNGKWYSNTVPDRSTGFDKNGHLLLKKNGENGYNYYLEGEHIKKSDGTVVEGYTVDACFNISQSDGTSSNLFFKDAAFQVQRTSYLYLTKSEDNGKSWSAPMLIQAKTAAESAYLVAPGRGITTSDGTIIFPCYSYNGSADSQVSSFIYSKDNGVTWTRSSGIKNTWSSENELVELSDGTLRCFFRNGNSQICYADYSNGIWGDCVQTGISNRSDCQISALKYSQKINGKDAIIISCPTDTSARKAGKIFVALVNEDKTLDFNTIQPTSVTDGEYQYSCLTELRDGSVGLLYENGAASIVYANFEMKNLVKNAQIGEKAFGFVDENNAEISTLDFKVGDTARIISFSGLSSTQSLDVTSDNVDVATASVDGNNVTISPVGKGTAIITATVNDASRSANSDVHYQLTVNVSENDASYAGNIQKIDGTTSYILDKDGIDNGAEYLIVASENALLNKNGETSTDKQSVTVDGNQVTGITDDQYLVWTFNKSGNGYTIKNTNAYLSLNGDKVLGTTEQKCTLEEDNGGYYIRGYNRYLRYGLDGKFYATNNGLFTPKTKVSLYKKTTTPPTWSTDISKLNEQITIAESKSQDKYTEASWNALSETLNTAKAIKTNTYASESEAQTAQNQIDDIARELAKKIEELEEKSVIEEITVSVGQIKTIEKAGTITKSPDTNIATIEQNGNNLIIRGVAVGKTSVTVGNVTYNITVVQRGGSYDTTVSVGGSTSVSIPDVIDKDETVVWSCNDYEKVGIYNSEQNSVTILGRNTGTTTVTATVKDKEENVIATYTWTVGVTDGTAPNAGSYQATYKMNNTIYNGRLYYSVDGGKLVEVPIHTKTKDNDGNTVYTYDEINVTVQNVAYSQMELFIKPDEGYAVTTVNETSNTSLSQFYSIDKEKLSIAYAPDHSGGTLESNLTSEQIKAVLAEAVANGCDAVFWYSCGGKGEKDKLENNDSKNATHVIHCDKLPTVEKTIEYLKHSGKYESYQKGMTAVEGDQVVFKIKVTTYKETANITYTNAALKDIMNVSGNVELYSEIGKEAKKLSNPYKITKILDKSHSETEENVYYAVYTLADDDLEQIIRNDVELSYDYQSQYSSGKYGGTAKANAQFMATRFPGIKDIVVDFGLPVKISVASWGKASNKITCTGKATYGDVKVEGDSTTGLNITYTPKTVLQGVDTVVLTNNKGATYSFKVYPATSVYYEEGFAIEDASKGVNTQTMTPVGENKLYGYDDAYATEKTDSNNSTATVIDGKTEFTFNGTGCDIYARTTSTSGAMTVWLYDENNKLLKLGYVDTSQEWLENSGELGNFYNTPVFSYQGLTAGTYKVVMKPATGTVELDGFRVYETKGSEYSEVYQKDQENNAEVVKIRDVAIAGAKINLNEIQDRYKYGQKIISAVYNESNNGNGAIILTPDKTTTDVTAEMINNGPKHEIYLKKHETLVLNLKGNAAKVAVGMRSLNGGEISYMINGKTPESQVASSVDLYYDMATKVTNGNLVIQNTGENVIALTKLKVTQFAPDTSSASLLDSITTDADTIAFALDCMMGVETPDTADATANLNLVDYTGKTIASTSLTANGEQGTDATFTADQIKSAVTSALPEGYAVVDASKIADQTVKYGESADVNVQIGKVATLKVTYKKLFGKTVGTATLTGVQTSAGSKYSFSASEIKKAVPSGYWTIKLWGTKVKYGTTGTLTVNVF